MEVITGCDGLTFGSKGRKGVATSGAVLDPPHRLLHRQVADKIDAICEGLSLLAEIPHSEVFEIARNNKVDLYGNEVDVVVYAEFADRAAFEAYKAHPNYAEATRRVRPLRDERYAADIVADRRG